MQISDQVIAKWKPLLDHEALPKITDPYRRKVTAQILENQARDIREGNNSLLSESAPANNIGSGSIGTWDPILIQMVRRTAPRNIAFDMLGVQPMNAPTGTVFAMRARYTSQQGPEAWMNEVDTSFSGRQPSQAGYQPQTGSNPFDENYSTGVPMNTIQGESLGDGVGPYFNQMAFSIDKVTVSAKTRALKAEYSIELAQDLKALHGMDAEAELANILGTEILSEQNREIIRTLYFIAKTGAQKGVTTPGTFDLNTDAKGRWLEETFKGLNFRAQFEANQILFDTRRGRGNFILCSPNVASAIAVVDGMTFDGANATNLTMLDGSGNTFIGTMKNGMKVFVDPYFDNSDDPTAELLLIGYKGDSPWDAGLFFCPYVPLQMVRAVGEESFQPKIGFKTRYGIVSNPYYTNAVGEIQKQSNPYYRLILVRNLV